jgi:hypothetical protein
VHRLAHLDEDLNWHTNHAPASAALVVTAAAADDADTVVAIGGNGDCDSDRGIASGGLGVSIDSVGVDGGVGVGPSNMFRLGALLGKGSFCSVYAAEFIGARMKLAVKVFEKVSSRTLAEVAILRGCHHANTVRLARACRTYFAASLCVV